MRFLLTIDNFIIMRVMFLFDSVCVCGARMLYPSAGGKYSRIVTATNIKYILQLTLGNEMIFQTYSKQPSIIFGLCSPADVFALNSWHAYEYKMANILNIQATREPYCIHLTLTNLHVLTIFFNTFFLFSCAKNNILSEYV